MRATWFRRQAAAIRKVVKEKVGAYRAEYGVRPGLVIGILKLGGHGDLLQQLVFAKAVRKRWRRALIVVFSRALAPTRAVVGGEVFDDHVDATLFANAAEAMRLGPIVHVPLALAGWRAAVPLLRGLVDCLWDVQYVAASYWRDLKRHGREQLEFDSRLKYYSRFYSGFPCLSNPELHCLRMTQFELLAESTGLDVCEDDLRLAAPDADAALADAGDYATLHNGAGGGAVLKTLPLAHMEAVAAALARQGLAVVQIGKRDDAKEPPILGTRDLRGLPMMASMAVMARAKLHVGIEGGPIYVAKGLGVPRAVFIGPTSPHVFGFADSVNLVRCGADGEPVCEPCWWSRSRWDRRCPKGLPYCANFPQSPEEAAEAVGNASRVMRHAS